ncbi:NAD(P)H-dependent glycerol-3-phosphate dehydrogenase [Flavihumibacter petaseus]|uniref:Glycerol-3-phosphate dehydrogenase n=1 Tax=Flavihumibacter petaseus NBRC 106054 TaxID=1220578 RepID=A0A0E9N593_9BACT|nr:NAD(P)H-dependent glycerol-3-phosphate dehydrogenase [Flavihumibacter petaseus]GAO45132.1 glycerol-3-phosphate dehydrogenase [Flavihumibacter petaseus NBRC 106054]
MGLGIIGSGSWATALAKIVTDNGHGIHWWVRSDNILQHLSQRKHNPQYLSSASFDTSRITLSTDLQSVIAASDMLVIAVPSAYLEETFAGIPADAFTGKSVVSAVKGMLPEQNILLNEWLLSRYKVSLSDYFTVMGPCHAEEVANEKLSYLTFSGLDAERTARLAACFKTYYINTIVNSDVIGVQYAAVLKNIYALGAGIAHGLEYGDNFQSVLIANCADEMAGFLQKVGIQHVEVGVHADVHPVTHQKAANYAASVYLGDLLVTCYSLFSRNRTFGNMIGKGYSVMSAQLEMNMVAEGYNASRCINAINQEVKAEMPIAETIFRILWQHLSPAKGFRYIEETLI